MHLHFERTTNARSDCAILSLTWMGKVPDEIPDDDGWKLNRTNYYQEGWLASGNVRGIVGVTFTTCHCKKIFDSPLRTNYNLRGHRSEVTLVKWNEPYQKLASCDSSGIIFVWIKYEGRWSIELINDRNTQVTDFSWSHDGRMALICYQDGFVLVGSVAGQRYWSSMLNLESTITCGIWTPDDQQVFFGTTDGQIIVMDVHGALVAQVRVLQDISITSMAWSCEKFKMEETDEDDGSEFRPVQTSSKSEKVDRLAVLAVCFKNGIVFVMKNYDDVSPIVIDTGLRAMKMEWSNSGEVLAVTGLANDCKIGDYDNVLKFYTETGVLRYSIQVPNTQFPVSALTWGHNDKRLFVATGCHIHIAWVTRKVASLQLLSRLALHTCLQDESQILLLPLPRRLRGLISSVFAQTIKCYIPEPSQLRDYVSQPPSGNTRLHCTMIRHDEELNLSSGVCYTLYLEYLGGLVPLLKGKRTSKIRPEFVIYDPQVSDASSSSESVGETAVNGWRNTPLVVNGNYQNGLSDNSDSEYEDSCASPRMQRRRRQRRRMLREQMLDGEQRLIDELTYIDTLPEQEKLVEVTSNIWGTKFKIHGVSAILPANLGQVTYKTSLLHLQPRQMTLVITELRDDLTPERDPNFNPNVFSEDEDDQILLIDPSGPHLQKEGIPIAPMTPRKQFQSSSSHSRFAHRSRTSGPQVHGIMNFSRRDSIDKYAALAQPEVDSEPDEFPYVDFTANPELLSLIERTGPSTTFLEYPTTSPSMSPFLGVQRKEFLLTAEGNASSTAELGAVPKLKTNYAFCTHRDHINSHTVGHHTVLTRKEVHLTNGTAVTGFSEQRTQLQEAIVNSPSPRRAAPLHDDNPRWAEKARDLKFIDDDEEISGEHLVRPLCNGGSLHQPRLLSRYRSRSVGYLNSVEILNVTPRDFSRTGSLRDKKRRLILSQNRPPRPRPKLRYCGKSRSLDSGMLSRESPSSFPNITIHKDSLADKALLNNTLNTDRHNSISMKQSDSHSLEEVCINKSYTCISRVHNSDNLNTPLHLTSSGSKSVNSTPVHSTKSRRPKSSSPIRKSILNSPLLSRRSRRTKVVESSDEEVAFSGDEILTHSFKDLESFQKAHIRQKLKKGKHHCDSNNASPRTHRRREFIMHNKAPLWNENSQVYQLDFGGRVTQESAKNFQIEFKGKQVMQFGRIDGNAYTLDFQYPFTAIQAFAVALANVTQRLK